MRYIFIKETYPDGLVKLVVEKQGEEGPAVRLGARGVPPALSDDAEYLEHLRVVALKEMLAERAGQPEEPETEDFGEVSV